MLIVRIIQNKHTYCVGKTHCVGDKPDDMPSNTQASKG